MIAPGSQSGAGKGSLISQQVRRVPARACSGTRWLALAVMAAVVGALWPGHPLMGPPPAAKAQPVRGQIVEHLMRGANSHPFGLGVDPSGNIWFSQWSTGIVGSIDPSSGRQSTFFIPTTNAEPAGLAVDATGDVWVAEHGADRIARLRAPNYGYDYYEVPTLNSEPYGLAIDAAGTVWFTAFSSNELGRLNPETRQVRTYRIPTPDSRPAGIVATRSGLIYFAEWAGNKIGRFDPATGEFAEWPLPNADSYVYEIAADADGRIWFAEHGGNNIGQLDPVTGAFQRYELPTQDAQPYGIAVDGAGYLWFSEWNGNKIGRFDPTNNTFQEFLVPTGNAQPAHLIVDASATVWFVQWNGNKIGQLSTLQPAGWAPALFKASDGRDSGLQIQNVSTGPATVSVRYLDAGGTLLYTDPAVVLPVGGAVTHYVPGKPLPDGFAGSAIVLSDGRVAAIVNETRGGPAGFASAAYDVPRRLATSIGLPLLERARGGWTTGFAVQNPSSSPARVTVRPYAPATAVPPVGLALPQGAATPPVTASAGPTASAALTGTLGALAPTTEVIPPGGTRLFDASTLAALGNDFAGSAVIVSEVPLAVVAWSARESGLPAQLGSYTGVPEGNTSVSLPLLFRDYNGWNTAVSVQNLGDSPARVTVGYYDRATGSAVAAAAESASIPPGASLQFVQAANANLSPGWVGSAVVASTNGAPIAAVVTETNPGRGLAMVYNGLSLGDATPRASVPLVMKTYHGWNTGVQVQNLGDTPATVTITYFDQATGAPVGGAIETQTVQPNTAYTFYQATATALPADFVGSAVVTGSGRLGVVVNGVNDARPGDGATSYNGVNY